MALMTLPGQNPNQSRLALFNLGFRPFFLGAAVYAIISIFIWLGFYGLGWSIPTPAINPIAWHAHEMIFGYSLAVIAGFLLTAVKNWTKIQTIHGVKLALLFSCWLIPRIAILFEQGLLIAAVMDILFILLLIPCVLVPIIKVKQWKQLGIMAKLLLMGLANILFYLGAFGILESGIRWGNYTGLYLIIGLILTMGRRVIPFFIERGVGYPVTLKNYLWLDISSLVIFLLFFIATVFTHYTIIAAWLAALLFVIHLVRIAGWYTKGIWRKPLLWSLYLAYDFIIIGFLLFALSGYHYVPVFLAIHSMAFGGIGLVTLSMMSRVSLGHTGRNVQQPPKLVGLACMILIMGGVIRVLLPILDMSHYVNWIVISQLCWIAAFVFFLIIYTPILIKPRVDHQFG
ncbi:NnrS family protein [Spartinivicinus poritis]|uniref:NnrS family protein n=1 Tax=Spartinivicinus poritis TaxID=2994640 RepID=A0ABT5UBJ5_9GAMM|nr:NnrS family protein [Spartinivicinus sp. A2-2]MDE1462897.1 NnrS family protein [Spartinivicinus sp. A2-2]